MRFINVRELKSKTSEILRAVAGEDIVVTNRGKPIVIVRKFDGSELKISAVQPAAGRVRETRAVYEPRLDAMNPLKAVFWDYPELTDEAALGGKIQEARDSPIQDAFRWYLARFLERGRAVDSLRFFRLDEIRRIMPSLRISHRAVAKWTGILEFYGNP
jgi:antitoxin (DNA-binding transcriptional repressor) of toxin-antitoxin stability system